MAALADLPGKTRFGHGTYNCANRGCKRPECLVAKRRYQLSNRHGDPGLYRPPYRCAT